MKTVLRLLLVVSVLYGTGAHWAALQGGAWAGMLYERASDSSFAEAVISTFSGEKPCHVCEIVDKGASTGSSAFLRSGPTLELAFTVPPSFVVLQPSFAAPEPAAPYSESTPSRPAAPPPKTVSLV